MDDFKGRRGYSHLKEEALDRTVWRHRFRGGFGPVVRQNTEWTNIRSRTYYYYYYYYYYYTLHSLFLYSGLPLPYPHPSDCLRLFSSQTFSRINTLNILNPSQGRCATTRTVPGSIPGGVTGLFGDIFPSDRTMALGSTQPLVKMSTRNIPGGKGSRCLRLTTYNHTVPIVKKSGGLKFLESSGPVQALYGTAFKIVGISIFIC